MYDLQNMSMSAKYIKHVGYLNISLSSNTAYALTRIFGKWKVAYKTLMN